MLYLDFSFSLYNTFELGLEGVDYDVEFSDLHRVLSTEYRPNIYQVETSRIIKQAFRVVQDCHHVSWVFLGKVGK